MGNHEGAGATLGLSARGGTERHDHAGSGLGLSIAREIVRTYGGRIQAENLPAGGFSIAVRLPVGSPPRCERTTA